MFGSVGSTWGNTNSNQQQQQQPSAFGQPSGGGFGTSGTSAFGQNSQQPPANPMFGGLGATGNTGTGTSGFGAFGGTNNTSTTSAFGAKPATAGFGAFGGGGTTSGTTAFGSGGSAFGQSSTTTGTGTGLFGQPATNTTSAFGSGGGIFGAAKAPSTSTFGAAAGTSTTPQPVTTGSSNPPFVVHQEKDPSNTSLTLQYQSISCMPAYQNTSVEELRSQDYNQGRKTSGSFGQSAAFGPTQPATTGLFGQPAQQNQTSAFGSTNTNTNTTGGFGGFGSTNTTQPATTSIFGGGGNTGTSAFGQTQPQPQPQNQTTTGFGAFGSTQQQQPTTSIFGGGNNTTTSAFGNNAAKPGGFGAFGSTTTTTGTNPFGGGTAFGQQNQQQNQQTTGLFGNTQPATNTTTTGFGAFGANNNQNQNKPLFGGTNATQPATTGFGAFGNTQQQNQQQPQQPQQGSIFGGGLFGNNNQQQQQQPQNAQQPATTSIFGNTNTATNTNPSGGTGLFGGGGLFGNNQNQQQQQQPATQTGAFGGGLFGNKPAATTTGSIFGNTQPAATNPGPTTNLFGSTLVQQPAAQGNPAFGGGLFGNKPANGLGTSMSTGQSGLFGSTAGNVGLFGASTNAPAQGTLTASIAQPIGSDLAIFDMLPPGPRTLNLEDSTLKKKAGFFVDVPIRAPVPRAQGYAPANSKLRGFGSSVNGSLGSSTLSFSTGSPNALSFSRAGDGRTSADPLALMRSSSTPALGSGGRQSIKKVILDKKVEPTELFRKSGSPGIPGGKIVFSPALSIAAREKEAREAFAAANSAQDSPTPAARKQHTPNRFTAQGTHNLSGDGASEQGAAELEEGDYWIKPDLASLKKTGFDELSSFSGLVIGRVGYGEIHFLEPVDLTGLPKLGMLLGDVVRFDDKECSVYPDSDEAEKPPPGSGLNVKAKLILQGCWAMDKATREPIKDPAHPLAVKHLKRLKHMKDTKFEDFDWKDGKWTFTVEHF